MYHHFLRICGDPTRAKYALCVYHSFDISSPAFVRTYQGYLRYSKALLGYLSSPDCLVVSFVKFRGAWKYSSLTHTISGASSELLNSARLNAEECISDVLA